MMKIEIEKRQGQNPFELVQREKPLADQKFEGQAIGFFKDAILRFRKNKASTVAAFFIGFIIMMAIIAPLISSFTYREQNIEWTLLPPRVPGLEKLGIFDGTRMMDIQMASLDVKYKDSVVKIIDEFEMDYRGRKIPMVKAKVDMYQLKEAKDQYFWMGTDSLGRDQWTRLWKGTRISLLIGFMAVTINVLIGITYGSISGYYGGKVDMIMQRIIEILNGVPQLVLVILFVMYLGAGIMPIILAMVITGWIGMSRMIRAQFYKYKGQEYVLASRTMGAKDRVLIFRHILPNAIGPIITQATLAVPGAIFTESFLSYLGLGIAAPDPSIGVLLADGQKLLLDHPHLTLFPAIVISILMLSFNLFGNGLRDAFDPTLRGQE
ncbi:ABC transporter permease [Paenibacillus melissococcoides]|uniref:ABC transporter permease n=1 Tax=Paenibacillus melissococcoides TaxID=2912268 RepID=A0ABN8U7A2_9BACL|nr:MULTISPECIES: ABC transporter permease [Paenibacillus]MEB9892727.1 ABC transporter permease [Bacillus cereus]CAH8247024.1 ABC transporter permease [Paenibacillus melissococcoides]CAH8716517.1 ABC transporter permease [Paenibacillus melissococcoides]CAH8717491.1 ABC transporter permease [Paenibacillus melissococcoides]GIO76562.1 peptide ABC transporter permease [Paenibacillus dendritiformis]